MLFAAAFVFASCSNGSDSGEGTPAPSVFAVSFGIEGLPPNGTIEARVDGTIIMPNDVVQKGKTVTFTAMPKTNHKVKEWKVDGAVISNTTNTYVHTVTNAVDVRVSFEALPAGQASYTVEHYQEKADGTYSATPTETEILNGTVGASVAYTPKTYEGFTYNSTLTKVNGTVQTGGTIHAGGSTVVELYYERMPASYTVTFSVEGGNGTLEAKVDGTEINSGDTVEHGKTVTFTAMPKTNHKVKEWKVDGAVISNTTNTYVHTVTDAVDVKVSFESAGGERIAITRVRAKTAPLVLGSPIPDGLSYTYTDYLPASVEGEPAKLIANSSTYGWGKKNGTEWQDVSGQPCTEGIYRVQTQVRIDGAESAQYMLAPDIKVFVSVDDGTSYDEWSVSSVDNYEGYSYAWVISKEYPVSSSGHLALSQNNVDIPKSYVGKPITEINIASIVSGGTLPYHFTLTSGALPAGLSLDESGAILGTPTAVQPGQTGRIAQITVRDSASTPEEKLIDVFCTEGIVDKKVVTFAVGWRGTAPAPIEVDSGQSIFAPAAPVPVDSNWAFSAWCVSQNDAQSGTGSSGTWDFSKPVTDHMTLYARWSDNRTAIDALTATMEAPVLGRAIPDTITYTYSAGSPAKLVNYVPYAWQVWNGTTWKDASGNFEAGKKYRINTQMRIDQPAGKTHRLATTGITVTVNGQAWTVGTSVLNYIDYNYSGEVYSYVWATSPEFQL